MDLDTCAGCRATVPAEDMEACHECGVPLCDSCGRMKDNKLLCRNCLEEAEVSDMEAELDRDIPELTSDDLLEQSIDADFEANLEAEKDDGETEK